MDDIQRVKDAIDLVTYIQAAVPGLKKAGRLYKALCPFHAEKTPSFVVNPETQSWRCYGACNTGGDLYSFAMKHHNWTFGEALHALASHAHIDLKEARGADRGADERLLGLLKTAADLYASALHAPTPASRHARAYITGRGLSEATLTAWGIGYAPDAWAWLKDQLTALGYTDTDLLEAGLVSRDDAGHTYDRFRGRLMFPICDERGRVRGFGGRALTPGQEPKYLNSPATRLFDKSRLLFGYAQAKAAMSRDGAVVVEGYLDVIQAHQAGYTNVVAQMGAALTEAQLHLISRVTHTLTWALDQDEAGQRATRRALTDLYAGGHLSRLEMEARVASWDGVADPDDLIRHDVLLWAQALSDAKEGLMVLFEAAVMTLPSSATIAQKQALLRDLRPVLAGLDPLTKRDALARLAGLLSLHERDLVAWTMMQESLTPRRPVPAAPVSAAPLWPPLEMLVLHGLIVNDDQRWIDRANASLMRLADRWPGAFAPLNLNDFSTPHTRGLMSVIQRAVEMGLRPFSGPVEEMIGEGPLHEVYERAVFAPQVQAVLAQAAPRPVINLPYDDFLKAVFTLRRVRLEQDVASQMLTPTQVMEWMQAKAHLTRPSHQRAR